MGSGIAEVHARSGLDVVVTEVNQPALDAGKARIEKSLQRGVKNGKLSTEDADAALGRLRFTTDIAEFADRELVIEAILEQEQAKVDVFRQLDKIVEAQDALFASNTSSIPIMKLGMATSRPQQVVGIHFFNPVPVLPLVELVPSLLTSEETARRAEEHATTALGKTVIRSQDRAGFIVNSLLVPYLLSAIRMIESGFASAEDIDRGMELGTAHPMGPLRLSDLIGLGAGLLPRKPRGKAEIALLVAYGVFAAYFFGLLMSLWSWPFLAGTSPAVGFVPGAPLLDNLHRFALYTVLTSTLGWDTGRAITNAVAIVLLGPAILTVLRRAARRAAFDAPVGFDQSQL